MKRTTLFLTFFGAAAVAAVAQETAPTPAAEVGLNYSFTRFNPAGVPSFTSSGGSGTFQYNFNSMLGVVADLGGYHNSADTNFNPTTFTYLLGPRLSLRKTSRFTPYVQALFGGAHVSKPNFRKRATLRSLWAKMKAPPRWAAGST